MVNVPPECRIRVSDSERRRRVASRLKMLEHVVMPHNKALQLTANPLRGLAAAELGRDVA